MHNQIRPYGAFFIGGMRERALQLDWTPETLPPGILLEADAAAFEAARFFCFTQMIARMQPTVVIGNERYGSLFVTEPLKLFFESIGVTTFANRVSSTIKTADSSSILPDRFVAQAKRDKPTIIVVDGTTSPVKRNCARLPRSLNAYGDWAACLGIRVCHFGNIESPFVHIGIERWPMQKPTGTGNELVLANVTTSFEAVEQFPELQGHIAGFFDDPEKSMSGHRVNAPIDHKTFDEAQSMQLQRYIAAVQSAITKRIPRWLERLHGAA